MLFEKHYGKLLIGVGSSLLAIGFAYIANKRFFFKKIDSPKKKDVEIDEKEVYIKKYEHLFSESYESNVDFNENIQKEFYIKEEYDKLIVQPNNLLESSWKRRILMEPTPFGNIIMFYNSYKQGFSYYCDENVPYVFLNAVAMKYVLKYFCRDFFIDNSIVPKNTCSPFLHIHEIEKKKETSKTIDVTKGPFAKLKTYKPDSKVTFQSTEPEKKPNFIKNKFIGCGKIYQFSPLQSVPKKVVKKDIPIKYSSFKQWHNPERFDMISDSGNTGIE